MLIPLIRKTHGKSLKVYCRIFFCGNYAIKNSKSKSMAELGNSNNYNSNNSNSKKHSGEKE